MLSPHLVHDVQVKLYRGTVLTMLSCCQGQELGLDQQVRGWGGVDQEVDNILTVGILLDAGCV